MPAMSARALVEESRRRRDGRRRSGIRYGRFAPLLGRVERAAPRSPRHRGSQTPPARRRPRRRVRRRAESSEPTIDGSKALKRRCHSAWPEHDPAMQAWRTPHSPTKSRPSTGTDAERREEAGSDAEARPRATRACRRRTGWRPTIRFLAARCDTRGGAGAKGNHENRPADTDSRSNIKPSCGLLAARDDRCQSTPWKR